MNQLEIQFMEDAPDGVFTIRRPFSVMTAYYVPRSKVKEAKGVKGINRYGVYCLYGNGRIYIGQTRNGIDRISEHIRGKQFWDEAILFLADPMHFNLNIISGLERYSIEMAMKNCPYEIENKSIPQYETISDFEQSQIVTIYDEISFIMTFLGIKNGNGKKCSSASKFPISALNSNHDTNKSNSLLDVVDDALIEETAPTFYTKKRGVKASLRIVGDRYVVMSGSSIDFDRPIYVSNHKGRLIREEAMDKGFIVRNDDGTYTLNTNCRFNSPSAAAGFVLGGSQNGKVEWLDGDGLTLANWLERHGNNQKESTDDKEKLTK